MNQTEKELEIIRSNNIDKYCPQGYLFCYDENGNLLFHNHNMIVKSGRTRIFNTLIAGSGLNLTDLKAYVGNSTSLVGADDEFEELGSVSSELTTAVDVSDNVNLITKFTITYTPDKANSLEHISTLGLVLSEGSGASITKTLFSRVVFPEYTANAELTFTYYIYF